MRLDEKKKTSDRGAKTRRLPSSAHPPEMLILAPVWLRSVREHAFLRPHHFFSSPHHCLLSQKKKQYFFRKMLPGRIIQNHGATACRTIAARQQRSRRRMAAKHLAIQNDLDRFYDSSSLSRNEPTTTTIRSHHHRRFRHHHQQQQHQQQRFLSYFPAHHQHEWFDNKNKIPDNINASKRPFSSSKASNKIQKFRLDDNNRSGPQLELSSGTVANLTHSSVLATVGDTVVLSTVARAANPVPRTAASSSASSADSVKNLTVDYRQRHHGVGQIPTTGNRRDNTRPSISETLGSRAIDRALRPLLQKQQQQTDDNNNGGSSGASAAAEEEDVLLDEIIHVHSSIQSSSSSGGNPVAISINAASAALGSLLEQPVAAVSLGVVVSQEEGGYGAPKTTVLLNPTFQECICELLYAGTRTHAVMAEFQCHSHILPEEELEELMALAHEAIQPFLDVQEQFQKQLQQQKQKSDEEKEKSSRAFFLGDDEERQIRADLGLPALPENDTIVEQERHQEEQEEGVLPCSPSISAIVHQHLEEATKFCWIRLGDSVFILFGLRGANNSTGSSGDRPMITPSYDTAVIHKNPRQQQSNLLSKTVRARREQVMFNEIQRLLEEYTSTHNITIVSPDGTKHDNNDDGPSVAEMLTPLVHGKILRRAFMSTSLRHGTRADGRGTPENPSDGWKTIRPLSMSAPALPDVVHGSALFARGDTQVLCSVTLGPPGDGIPRNDPYAPATTSNTSQALRLDNQKGNDADLLPVGCLRYLRSQEALASDMNSRKVKADREMTGESGTLFEKQRAFLQYDFPPYSTGETPQGKGGGANHNRRAIGHGALAEKALLPVLPTADRFPYAIRMTSEVTDSNGSSSMASVCGSTLALLDAGVPIVAPVAGVSVGLALSSHDDDETKEGTADANDAPASKDDKNTTNSGNTPYRLLLDITGTEDHYGGMDFKIAGTAEGVTAFQLDVKEPLELRILADALVFANAGRRAILDEMRHQVGGNLEPRPELKDSAPRVEIVRFDPERKRDLVGPGGAVLRQLEDRYGVALDMTQDGQCLLHGPDRELVEKAKSAVMDLVADVEVGEIYDGIVVEIKDFGAIIELLRSKEGLLHVSELGNKKDDNNKDGGSSSRDKSAPKSTNLGIVQEHLYIGQKIKVKCTAIDPVQGHIRLTRKGL